MGGAERGARPGAPRSPEARLRWWHLDPSPPVNGRSPGAVDEPITSTVREVLNYFAKCPRCGYAAQASSTTRTFVGGRVETTIYPTCGLPCGWHGTPRVLTDPVPHEPLH
ncbi:hypothetical protein [Nocardia sp. CA-120079]|uniref:hypothetical protein n=1 Tax=Nocardia sp. CA-120079 TaxID=3239974 RepID=UPI003D95D2BA